MLQVSYIKENRAHLLQAYQKRNFEAEKLIDQILQLDEERKSTQYQMDEELAAAKTMAKKIGELFQSGKSEEANRLKEENKLSKEKSQSLKERLQKIEKEQNELLYHLPNVPNQAVPPGKSEEDNQVIEESGSSVSFEVDPLPHWELAKKYNLIDFELGVKISGAGFPVYMGKGAKLQRALINFFLDEAEAAGYHEILPPHLVNEASGFGTGQLPDKEGQMYHIGEDDLYLIPTAEVPITNLYRDVILNESDFPIKNCAYTPCFRREAGSYGKDVRGLNRLHQFDKVEIVRIEKVEDSYRALEEMTEYVKSLLQKLGLPFRLLLLSGGDLGFTSSITYDFEVFSSAQKRWLEVSSVSNFEAFQANRLKLRYKSKSGKNLLAHTLNGSALALPRIMAALLENNQDKEGINVPKVLIPYTKFSKIN